MTTGTQRQFIFLDPGIPDIADLIDGARPGDQVFVLQADGNGLEQIADILASENLSGLDSIAIVSHGDTGELRLGSALLTDGNLAGNSAALAEIGAALAPGGAIQLYGCDVAQGAAGQRFIDDFSTLAGGATVEAATHLVGDAASGGNWALDAAASDGAPAAPPPEAAPFTSAAQASFQGLLSATPNGQLFYRINQSNDVRLGHINSDGSNVGTVYVGGGNTSTPPGGGGLGNETAIAVDPAAGLVFGVGVGNKGSYDAFSVHSLNTGSLISTTEFGANTGNANTDDVVQALAINPFTQTLYVGDWGTTTSNTGIRQFSYNPLTGGLTPLATNGGFAFTSSQISGGITNANALFLDRANNLLYYVDCDTGYDFAPFNSTNSVNVINLSTLSRTQLTSNGSGTGQFPLADQQGAKTFIGAHGNLVGLAVDVADNIVYFESTDNLGSSNIALWRVSTSAGANQTATKISLPAGVTLAFAGQTNEGGDAAGLSFDPTTDQLYLTNANNNVTTRDLGAIYVMQMTTVGNAVSLVHTFDTATLVGQTPATVDSLSAPSTTFFDVLPTLGALSGTATSPVEQGAAVTLLTGAPGISDPDGSHLASATVQITGGTFTSNENSSSDDHLGVLDGGTFKTSGTITGTSITIGYTSATETLTLSGYDTLTNYQAALGKVQYETIGDNPTNYGSNQTRTLTWQANDGAVGNPTGPTTGTTTTSITAVNDPPTLSGTVASVGFTEQGAAVTLSPSASVGDPDDHNLSGATVSVTGGKFAGDGGTLATTVAGTGISASYDGTNEVLTLSGLDTLAHYQLVLDKIRFTTASDNPTNFGANPGRTLSWVLNDAAATGSNGIQSTTVTTSISVTPINDAPSLTGTVASVGFTEQSAAVALSPSATVTDVDDQNLSSATVSITTGAFAGDGDVLAATTAGTSITASYNSATEVLSLTGTDTLANYQTVLDSVSFTTSSDNPTNFGANATRTLSWVVKDPGGTANGGVNTATVTTSISITAINDPPALAGMVEGVGFSEGSAAVTLSPAASVTDPDDVNLSSATVSITAGTFATDGDVLAASTAGTGITASYDSANEILTLSGSDTLAHYQTVLGRVSYTTASDNPDNFGADPTRTLSWVLKDPGGTANGGVDTTTVTTSVSITAINDAPTLAGVPSADKVSGSTTVTLAPAVTVTDPDNLDLVSATVSITGGTGNQLAADTTGTAITASYDTVNQVLTLSGTDTLADYQAVLDKVTFESSHSNGSRTIDWVLNDGSASNNLSTPQSETLTLACYRRGTRIATDRGEQPIETLAVGDRVMTPAGEARPIVWVGQRTVNCLAHPRPELVWPVRIEAGAFGNAMPARALDLSPDHAVFCNGVLVAVRRLVNGATIRQVAVPTVTYHHVELARHDLLLAEGLPAESYLDTGNRTMFEDAAPVLVLHADFATGQHGRETRSCAPFIDAPDQLQPMWRAIAERAVTMGWRLPGASVLEDDPDLRIVVGARCLRPVAAADGRYTFVLPADDAPARLVSRSTRPTLARPWLNDERLLGVRVRRLIWRGAHVCSDMAMDDPTLAQGWWAVERDDHGPCRWTRGDAIIPVIGEGVVEVELAGTLPYQADRVASTAGATVRVAAA